MGWPARGRPAGGRDLELRHAGRALAVGGAEAIRAGVAAADDHDVLAGGGDELLVGDLVSLAATVLQREVLHREMDASQLPPRHLQVACSSRATSEDDRVVSGAELVMRDVDADVRVGLEDDPFLLHQIEPSIEPALLQFELGDSIPQQPADPIGALEHGHQVTGAIELRRRREAGRTRADDCYALAAAPRRRVRHDPALLEGAFDDRVLGRLDRNRRRR